MTVSSTARRAGPFTGNGVTTAFPFAFKVFAASDLEVTYTDAAGVAGVINTGYTVALNADQDANPGGTITYPSVGAPMAAPATLAIVGDAAYEQTVDISNAGRFLPQVIENALDRATVLAQQLLDKVGRSLIYPAGEAITGTLPARTLRPGKFLSFDANGDPSVSVGTGADAGLRTDLAAAGGAALLGLRMSALGSAARTLLARLGDMVFITDFTGCDQTGVADSTTALAAAYAAVPAGGVINLPPGTYRISSLDVTGKTVTLVGYGASIICTSASGAITKTDHANKLTVLGIAFSGAGRAININATPSTSTTSDFLIRDCVFTMNAGVYGAYLVGAREGYLRNCTFNNSAGGNGLYLQQSVSPFVEGCLFIGTGNVGTALFYDGTGSAYDAGLVLQNSEVMGWAVGVDVRYCDWLKISGCTIDYNTTSNLTVYSQDGAVIEGNYLGSPNANPALALHKGVLVGISPPDNDKITIIGNHFTGHYTGGNTYDCLLMTDTPQNVLVQSNHFDFYTRYGINYTTSAQLNIVGNTFAPRSAFGVLPIFNASGAGDARVLIANNQFPTGTSFAGSGISFARLRDNGGYVTRNTGQFITDGVSTTFTIAHGLNTTPDSVSLAVSAGGMRPLRVYNLDATNIYVATDAVYAAFGIYWSAEKHQGV